MKKIYYFIQPVIISLFIIGCSSAEKPRGCEVGDCLNGKGKIQEPATGVVYEGDFKDGKKDGKGKYKFQSGSVYDGEYLNNYRTGNGTYTWSSGDTYTGGWKDGKMNGKGTYVWSSGDRYEGDWKEGIIHGEGNYTWPDGGRVNGRFENGKLVETFKDPAVKIEERQ